MIYLDYAASAPPYPQAAQQQLEVSLCAFGNPGAIHTAGNQSRKILHESRMAIARLLKVREQEVFFTSGGTESNNLAFFGTLKSALKRNPHIITTKIEHPSVLEPLKFLESCGAEVTYLDVDERGFVSPDDVAEAVRENTKIVSVMLVNNETGAIQPISEISKKVKEKIISFLADSFM